MKKLRSVQASILDEDDDKNITRMLLPSLLGIILCMILLASSTWAYFISTLPPSKIRIEAANFDVVVEMSIIEKDTNEKILAPPKEDGSYSLIAGETYSVNLTAQGSASTGYCVMFVKFEGNLEDYKYYTDQISQGESMSFFIISNQSIQCSFEPTWGTYSGTYNVSNGETFEIPLLS